MAIPGFGPRGATLQNHIHLGLVAPDGSGPTGFLTYGEPPYRMAVNRRLPVTTAVGTLRRAWSGAPSAHVLKDSNGMPYQFKDMRFSLLVDDYDYRILETLLKTKVYFVDVWHCNDTTSHTGFIKTMWLEDLGYEDHLSPNIAERVNSVFIVLRDLYTVASI